MDSEEFSSINTFLQILNGKTELIVHSCLQFADETSQFFGCLDLLGSAGTLFNTKSL